MLILVVDDTRCRFNMYVLRAQHEEMGIISDVLKHDLIRSGYSGCHRMDFFVKEEAVSRSPGTGPRRKWSK